MKNPEFLSERRILMTYRELRECFNRLSQEQLDMDVSLYDITEDDFFTLQYFISKREDLPAGTDLWDNILLTEGILDDNHPFLMF